MTMTKAVGAVCGSLLVLMLVGWAGNSLYTVGAGEHGEHAGEHEERKHDLPFDTAKPQVPHCPLQLTH